MRRYLRRWACHRTFGCCQYVDSPLCNSPLEPHWFARWRYLRNNRIDHGFGDGT